jgi:hypothetical protein
MRSPSRAEALWWLALVAWVALAALWRPDPPVSFLDAPSASPRPPGYAVFHDLLERHTAGVRRLLGRADQLPAEVGTLVVLSPSEPVPESHRAEMMDWVASSGGTLLVGHPLPGGDGAPVSAFHREGMWPISEWRQFDRPRRIKAYWPPSLSLEVDRIVPDLVHEYRGELSLSEYGAEALLVGENDEVLASLEGYGSGNVIQLAGADLLDNDSLGRKRTHSLAAALIDLSGADSQWAIDESHEGIESEPSLVRLIGSGRWRAVLLQVLLVGIFAYWWASSRRLVRRRPARKNQGVREVSRLARDIGEFYLRAGRGRWALERSLERLRASLRDKRGAATGAARLEAEQAERLAAEELAAGRESVERCAAMVRSIALAEEKLMESTKGRGS